MCEVSQLWPLNLVDYSFKGRSCCFLLSCRRTVRLFIVSLFPTTPLCVCLCVCARPGRQLVSVVRSVRLTPPPSPLPHPSLPRRGPPFYSRTRSRKLFSETRQKLHLIKPRKCLGTWAPVTELIGKTYLTPPSSSVSLTHPHPLLGVSHHLLHCFF